MSINPNFYLDFGYLRTWSPSEFVEVSENPGQLHEDRVSDARLTGSLVPSVVVAPDYDVTVGFVPPGKATYHIVHRPESSLKILTDPSKIPKRTSISAKIKYVLRK